VSRVVKAISNVLKFRTACLTSVSDLDSEQRKLRLGTEVHHRNFLFSLLSIIKHNRVITCRVSAPTSTACPGAYRYTWKTYIRAESRRSFAE
jgi:hypothetical protein